MSGPTVPAELAKLAHTLGRTPSELDFLAAVPAAELRDLRGQVSQALFGADRLAFERVAALARRIPVAVAARVAEVALPPLLAGRVAELLDPGKAVELVGRLRVPYLADVSAVLDVDRARHVVAALPQDRVEAVARELGRRAEWVVIAALISRVSSDALPAAVRAYDGEQLLRIGSVLDDRARLGQVAGLLTDEQVDEVLAAASSHALWAELDHLINALGPERTARCAARLAAADPRVRADVESAIASGRLSGAAAARLTTA